MSNGSGSRTAPEDREPIVAVRREEVLLAVSVEVAGRHGEEVHEQLLPDGHIQNGPAREAARSALLVNGEGDGTEVRMDEVLVPVPIEVRGPDRGAFAGYSDARRRAAKGPARNLEVDRRAVAADVGRGEVQVAVAIEVRERDGCGTVGSREDERLGREDPGRDLEEHRQVVARWVGGSEVQVAIRV